MKLTLLGAVVAALIVGLIPVTAASAAGPQSYHVEKAPAFVQAKQAPLTFVFKQSPANLELRCGVSFRGEVGAVSVSPLSMAPDFSGELCKLNGVNINFTTNHCEFVLGAPSEGAVGLELANCPPSAPFTMKTTGCTWTYTNQSPVSGVTLQNVGSARTRAIDMTWKVTGFRYSQTSGCPGGPGNFSNLELSLPSTAISGYKNVGLTEPEGLWFG